MLGPVLFRFQGNKEMPIEELLKGIFVFFWGGGGERGSGDKEGEISSDFSVFSFGAS